MAKKQEMCACFQREYRISGLIGQNVVCDLFDSQHGTLPRSAFVFLHGGGFVGGSRDQFFAMASWISLTTNSLCISVDYRIASVAPYPAPIIDCLSVFQWILRNKDVYRIDPALVFVVGGSSGANIGGMAMMADEIWLHRYGIKNSDLFQPHNGIFLNGIYNLSDFYERNKNERKNVQLYLGEDENQEVLFNETSFTNWNLKGKNLLLLHGSQDQIIPISQCFELKKETEINSGKIQIIPFDGKQHAWFNNSQNLYSVLEVIKQFVDKRKNEVEQYGTCKAKKTI